MTGTALDTDGRPGQDFAMLRLTAGKARTASARYAQCATLDAAAVAEWRAVPGNDRLERILRRIIFRAEQ